MKNLLFLLIILLISCSEKRYIDEPTKIKTWNGTDTLKIMMDSATDPSPKVYKTNNISFTHKEELFHSEKEKKYILKYLKTAKEEDSLFNIPASITLAQGLLESGYGLSTLATRDNAHFGIKPGSWVGTKKLYNTKEWDGSKFITVKAYFRTYPSAWWSYRNRSKFLTQTPRYKPCFKCEDYKCWAKQLQKCGYATDPHYAKTLISIIERNKLYIYDKISEL
jgi:flagellum-specific peptidoglycan hydrolase FlgJ